MRPFTWIQSARNTFEQVFDAVVDAVVKTRLQDWKRFGSGKTAETTIQLLWPVS